MGPSRAPNGPLKASEGPRGCTSQPDPNDSLAPPPRAPSGPLARSQRALGTPLWSPVDSCHAVGGPNGGTSSADPSFFLAFPCVLPFRSWQVIKSQWALCAPLRGPKAVCLTLIQTTITSPPHARSQLARHVPKSKQLPSFPWRAPGGLFARL